MFHFIQVSTEPSGSRQSKWEGVFTKDQLLKQAVIKNGCFQGLAGHHKERARAQAGVRGSYRESYTSNIMWRSFKQCTHSQNHRKMQIGCRAICSSKAETPHTVMPQHQEHFRFQHFMLKDTSPLQTAGSWRSSHRPSNRWTAALQYKICRT